MNDRLLLGLKGTMSEYELSLLRQRGLAARDAKAGRGALRFQLPPGYCWSEDDRIEIDPDELVQDAIRLVFEKFRELGSARQVFLWARMAALQLPVVRRNGAVRRIDWRPPAYHSVVQILHNPIYAGAHAFGRTEARTRVDRHPRGEDVRPSQGDGGLVLIRDHHDGYISWEQFEENKRMLAENAHMKRRMTRKAGRGGRALLTGMVRCARCGRMMRVFYRMQSEQAHRYQCRGDDAHVGWGLCIGIGGVAVDKAVAAQLLEAVSERAVDAAILAAEQGIRAAAVSNAPASASWRKRVTRPVSRSGDTNMSTLPSVTSPAPSRSAGTRRWNASPRSRRASPGSRRSSRRGQGSIATPCCALPRICRRFGRRPGLTRAPSSASSDC